MKIVYSRGLYPVCCICCVLCFMPYLAAQTFDPAAPAATDADDPYFGDSVISVNSSLVSVPVAVTDISGYEVVDLRIEDFHIAEDGRKAEISQILESSNLNIALLFDLSGSVNNSFEFEQNAAIEFLKKIWKEGDSVTLISFDEQPEVVLKNGDNLQEAMWMLRQLKPTGKTTSFFDALILAVGLIEQSDETRQTIVVISDGADNTSRNSFAAALAEMQRRNAVFYAINPSGAAIVRLNKVSGEGQKNLEAFAKTTGGNVFVSDDTSGLESIFVKISQELRAQYLLLYYSLVRRMDGKFHTIEVSVPNRRDLNVRARPGFLADHR